MKECISGICSSPSGCIVVHEPIIFRGDAICAQCDAIGVYMSQPFRLPFSSLKGSNIYGIRHRRMDMIWQRRMDMIRQRRMDMIRQRRMDMIWQRRMDMIRQCRMDMVM